MSFQPRSSEARKDSISGSTHSRTRRGMSREKTSPSSFTSQPMISSESGRCACGAHDFEPGCGGKRPEGSVAVQTRAGGGRQGTVAAPSANNAVATKFSREKSLRWKARLHSSTATRGQRFRIGKRNSAARARPAAQAGASSPHKGARAIASKPSWLAGARRGSAWRSRWSRR